MNNQQTTNAVIELADKIDPPQDKEKHMKDYITSIKAIEEAMEPYKEQKRELRKEYNEQNWLTSDEQRMATKAYRLLKDDVDLEQLMDFYETIKKAKHGLT